MGPGALQQLRLGALREDTEYEIVVRAYNSAGKGPLSMPVVGRTREKGIGTDLCICLTWFLFLRA